MHFINHSSLFPFIERNWGSGITIFVEMAMIYSLIIILLLSGGSASLVSLLQVLPADTSGLATSEGRADREVDVLLRVQSHHERRDVHDLLADTVKINRRKYNQ